MSIETLLASELVQFGLIGLARGVMGWAENAIEDGKITFPELQLLGATVIRVGIEAFSFAALGFAPEGAIALDFALSAVKKKAQAPPV